MITQYCANAFDAAERRHGQQYAAADFVNPVQVDEDGLYAEVNSWGNRYLVSVDWSSQDDGILRVCCECRHFDQGNFCKHIWATLVKIDQLSILQPEPSPPLVLQRLDFDEDEDDEEEDDEEEDNDLIRLLQDTEYDGEDLWDDDVQCEDALPGNRGGYDLPPLRIPLGPGRPSVSEEPPPRKWSDSFRQLYRQDAAGPQRTSQVPPQKDRLAWYVLDASDLRGNSALIIDLYCQELKKNGEYGKIKRLRYDDSMLDSFAEECDRQVLPQLAACSREASRPHYYNPFLATDSRSSLELRRAMHSTILPRLAATGRLRWLSNGQDPIEDGYALTWDDAGPWGFRLQILPDDESQHWALTGQFVRQDEVIPMEQAVGVAARNLLLTQNHLRSLAPNAPLRWISWAQEHSPLRVPYAQREVPAAAAGRSPRSGDSVAREPWLAADPGASAAVPAHPRPARAAFPPRERGRSQLPLRPATDRPGQQGKYGIRPFFGR